MKYCLLYCTLFVLLSACGQSSEDSFYVKGKIQNLPESTDVKHKLLLLEIPDLMQFYGVDMKSVVDTAEIIEDGSFAFTDSSVIKDSLFYRVLLVEEDSKGHVTLNLDMVNENYTILFLHDNSHIQFESSADQFNHDLSFEKADHINKSIRNVYDMQKENNDKLTVYAKDLRAARQDSLSADEINNIKKLMMALYTKNGELVKSYADTVSDPYLLINAMQGYPFLEDSAYALSLYNRLNTAIPNSVYTTSLNDIIEE